MMHILQEEWITAENELRDSRIGLTKARLALVAARNAYDESKRPDIVSSRLSADSSDSAYLSGLKKANLARSLYDAALKKANDAYTSYYSQLKIK